MKKSLFLAIALAINALFTLLPFEAKAIIHFDDSYNFDAYSMGSGRIHFKALIYWEDRVAAGIADRYKEYLWSDYTDYPNAWYQISGGAKQKIVEYTGNSYWNKPGRDGRPEEYCRVSLKVVTGTLVVTNTYTGTHATVNADGQWHDIDLRRSAGGDYLTFVEFDWYMPTTLTTSFSVGIYSPCVMGTSDDEYTYQLGSFPGYSMDQQPELLEPVFYPSSDHAPGYIGVPYLSYQETYQYNTSLNPTVNIPIHDRSGLIYVPSTDSAQHGLYINLQTKMSQSTADVVFKQWLKSSKVNVPAYHRIYNMQVQPYKYHDTVSDIWFEDYRFRDISWQMKFPHEKDAMDFDFFEIQRAYKPDFSDAVTIVSIDMDLYQRDSAEWKTFHYVDSTRGAWTNPTYPEGSDSSAIIFYRVRRVSASPWGWAGNPYADSASNSQEVYLQSLSTSWYTRLNYTTDSDFTNNHKVHIALYPSKMDINMTYGSEMYPRQLHAFWDDQASLIVERIAVETQDTTTIRIPADSINSCLKRYRVLQPYVLYAFPINYTDQLYLHCVHYQYRVYIDTVGALLKLGEENPTTSADALSLWRNGGIDPYFTNAANLDSLSVTNDLSDCILLHWDIGEGGVDEYTVERREYDSLSPNPWRMLGSTTDGYWRDATAEPNKSLEYRVTALYTCNGTRTSSSRTMIGNRSQWGSVSGRIHYENGSGCPGVAVVAMRTGDSLTVQTVTTDNSGRYVLDSLPYADGYEYAIFPVSQSAQYRYNHTSSGSATVALTLSHCKAENINFENISSVRFTGRVLYQNSSIPVRDANFLLNGMLVSLSQVPLKTDASGNFELCVPQNEAFTLQVVKDGHHFLGDGFVRINGDSLLTLQTALDGVRVWDQTKVRLAGRLSGGLVQRDLPLGFALSHNNLGEDLRLVLELEGDNISYIVRDPSDLTKDTLEFRVPHLVYNGSATPDTVGWTKVHYQQRRIIIDPDSATGEYCADLFPVRYKVTQATANGYATLFPAGTSMDVIDLSAAAAHTDTATFNNRNTISNAQYKVTYRSPISITCRQMQWGIEVDWFGERTMLRDNILNQEVVVPLATKLSDNTYHYTFGVPVFKSSTYDFRAYAHEDYYYNNDPTSIRHDRVQVKGGTLKVYNGMYDAAVTPVITKDLDTNGTAIFSVPVNYASFTRTDSNVIRTLDLSVEHEGQYVVSRAVSGYVTGDRNPGNISTTHGSIQLLDVLRDPPGSASTAYLENGTSYSYSYVYDWKVKFGFNFAWSYGQRSNFVIGTWEGEGGGPWAGTVQDISSVVTTSIPITGSFTYKHQGTYNFKTTDRITTSGNSLHVGQDADIYIGLVQNVYSRLWDAVKPMDSLTYAAFSARSADGTMPTVASGVAADGKPYYLVIGREVEMGPKLQGTFAYTHDYIKTTVIPQLIAERDALLLTCDSATAQQAADARNEVVYWSRVPVGDTNWAREDYYRPLTPANYSATWNDRVDHYNRLAADWVKIMIQNEAEKVNAIHGHYRDSITTYSIGNSTVVNHDEEYSYSNVYHVFFDYPGASFSAGDMVSNFKRMFGEAVADKVGQLVSHYFGEEDEDDGGVGPREIIANAQNTVNKFQFTPVTNVDFDRDPTENITHTRKIGYKIQPDDLSHIDVAVYRTKGPASGNWFNDSSADTRDHVDGGNFSDYDDDTYLYGSPVFYLLGGATKCPCELADSTEYFVPKMPISAGSLRLENPQIDINVHERSNVPVDRPAVFTIYLSNEIEEPIGAAAERAMSFSLKLNEASNPHGARIYIDGMPLTDGRTISGISGTNVIAKTVEVYAGDGYDFENLIIEFGSTCHSLTKSRVKFSVHFMPVSTPVVLDAPRQNWVLNTQSPQDSIGYYLPVTISGFDVNYREFDHIELQYKLSTQSDDDWVNLCSYFYDSTLYRAATGTKAMINGGRIDNIRFYGERDPMEQRYDLRAVSFCRHGSGFVTRPSEVMRGIKDTRRPRVFGQPLPANGILGVGDDLKLRFSEPIAGNYIDEDNNFQILGSTNSTGITSSTSVFFDGTPGCGATSAVTRVLDGKSFSVDLMVKPSPTTSTNRQELFGHATPTGGISFGLKPENATGDLRFRLYAYINEYDVQSLPLDPMTDFTRVVMTYNDSTGRIRFFAGTLEVTDPQADTTSAGDYSGEAPLVLGHGYKGNMLEARLWFKPLTQDEIVLTNRKRLTGFERKLAAYYPMNEGRGETLHDKANGSTLTLHGSSWTTPSGYSLHLDGRTVVKLDQNILNRSSIQDYTLMFWFRTNEYNAGLYSAGWDGTEGTLIALENGHVAFHNGSMVQRTSRSYADGLWHHYVISVNRTYNNASIYIDGSLVNTFASDGLSGLNGETFLGGVNDTLSGVPPFTGHFDGIALFEQALPQSLIETFDNLSPMGDELGLIAYLPFNEQRENDNSIMEEVFSINNRRIVMRNGEVLDIVQPLVISPVRDTLLPMADGNVRAPIRERDLVTRMNFDWSYNNDQLLINLNMADHEINKSNIYVTVRNIEDLNGNRTVSPTTWQVFVNKNTLLWESDGIDKVCYYSPNGVTIDIPVRIRNNSGRRHQYKIEGMPDWLTVDRPTGSIEPQESLTLNFSIDSRTLAVGDYSELIYLTDEEDLSESLKVHIVMKAVCPWYGLNTSQFDRQMSLRAQVKIDGRFITNPEDVVVAVVGDTMVGYANVSPGPTGNGSYIYMTVYGNAQTEGKQLKFRAWMSSTGRIFNLTSDTLVTFQTDALVGLPPVEPLQLYSTSTTVQYFDIYPGWNWVSLNIAPDADGALSSLFFMHEPFRAGDQIKEAYSRRFAEWDGTRWRGTLTKWDYRQVYMIYSDISHFDVQVNGDRLETPQQHTLTLKHNWNSLPYLLTAPTSITEALADYVDHATVGDLVKSHNAFAVFSENQRWEGSLTAMHPGQGYLLKRQATTPVTFTYHGAKGGKGGRAPLSQPASGAFAASQTTMTIIAATDQPTDRVVACLDGQPVVTAQPIDGLYFVTIPADRAATLTFILERDGGQLGTAQPLIPVSPDAHYGSCSQPVLLTLAAPAVTARPTIFTDHVDVTIPALQGEALIRIYNAAGVLIGSHHTRTPQTHISNLENLPAGIYFATINSNDNTTTIKLIKK